MKIEREDILIQAIEFLKEECHKTAKDHGFWEDEDFLIEFINNAGTHSDYPFSKLDKAKQRIISLFNSEKIALEMSELAERLETLRNDPTKMDKHCPEFFNIEIEVADLIIRALDFAGRRKLRIVEALIAKMKFNRNRTYKHGKNF